MPRFASRVIWIEAHGLAHQAEIVGDLKGVLDMHEMGPAFRPVLPRMRCCVRTDVAVLPVRRRSARVIPLERFRVVHIFVSKKFAVTIEEPASPHESVPIIVTNLVPEMHEKRAVGLSHCLTYFFPHRIVSLGDIQCNQPFFMSGQNFGSAAVGLYPVFKEGEGETLLW